MSDYKNDQKLKPLVGVVSDVQIIGPHIFHTSGDKYLRALSQAADVIPVVIPCLQDDQDIKQWIRRLDGVFLTGAYSMVDPKHYGEQKIDKPYDYDERRDELSFQTIRSLIEADLPLLGVCRGLQDINVALGGSLYQAVQEVPGNNDHREDKNQPLDIQYGDVHNVNVTQDGLLHRITGRTQIKVNSLHSQGINKVGEGLTVEARADDNLVEAISVDQMTFGLAVQWHPEWKVAENPIQRTIFEAFGDACRAR
ncbi:gamma-glutamyl-gamma-aminobutyrate hydrolase family protein [Litoribrevibacter albus]|uniref:gamma-glutamyl-gamma-aminobutyrate hydrolase n=1 Tax=Litoribrevibacter albus TaxID=1473156 RepID=A0AA37S5A2_9GAMM|nr:gamma-glutamyl-gamma-aminobutyrate hydrolase family protein [Litoribrevibacter albus]GLQ29541.1 gamma-glutamyl-gamma-aminobutyrate hydrolase [Litoribrevibacter albus]